MKVPLETIVKAYAELKSTYKVGKLLGLGHMTVYYHLKKVGVQMPGKVLSDHPNWKGGKTISSRGYVLIKRPGHPGANSQDYISESRLVMEGHLCRYLTSTEVVHHIDRDKLNNHIENLRLFPSQAEHTRYHRNQERNS